MSQGGCLRRLGTGRCHGLGVVAIATSGGTVPAETRHWQVSWPRNGRNSD